MARHGRPGAPSSSAAGDPPALLHPSAPVGQTVGVQGTDVIHRGKSWPCRRCSAGSTMNFTSQTLHRGPNGLGGSIASVRKVSKGGELMIAADVFTTLDVELKPDPSRTMIRPFSFAYPDAFAQEPPEASTTCSPDRGVGWQRSDKADPSRRRQDHISAIRANMQIAAFLLRSM